MRRLTLWPRRAKYSLKEGFLRDKTVKKIEDASAAPVKLKRVAVYARVSLETERLNQQGIPNGHFRIYGYRWEVSNIKVVLTNITYTGCLLLQKEYISDPVSKKRKKNHGGLPPQYFVPDMHEAIIDRETFDYVQSEIARRRELGPLANKALNTCCFTGKIK